MYQLTDFTNEYSKIENIRNQIEKDYPKVTKTEVNELGEIALFVGNSYWEYCQDYVSKHCKTKGDWK